jgi:transcription elongation factor Elf1
MASWVLGCKNCAQHFEHSAISDTLENFYLSARPKIAAEGESFKCPHCGHATTYFASELIYRS